MKLFKNKLPLITKKYLRLAGTYRRFAERSTYFDFSLKSLIECFRYETFGETYSPNNGYVFGKHGKDISISMWIEDIQKGNACKAEFLTPCNKWFAESALKNIIPGTLFLYEK